jgi:hypothetical protein
MVMVVVKGSPLEHEWLGADDKPLPPYVYTFQGRQEAAKRAVEVVVAYFKGRKSVLSVESVEDDKEYQAKDIDLIVKTTKSEEPLYIEVKGDTYDTGNFFFETQSNMEKKTPGCFFVTEANFIFYYFIQTQSLYSIPMPKAREELVQWASWFEKKKVKTKVGKGEYTTVGRIVPISFAVMKFGVKRLPVPTGLGETNEV